MLKQNFFGRKSYQQFQKCSELYNKMYFKFGGLCIKSDDARL